MQKPKLKKKDFKHSKRTGKEFVLECSILSRQIRITVNIIDNFGRSTWMIINYGQTMSINMLSKESALFRSIPSVSLLLSLYEISHYALHAAII